MRVAVVTLALFGVLLSLDVGTVPLCVEDGGADSVLSYPNAIERTAEVLLGGYLGRLAVQGVNQVYSLVYLEAQGHSLDGADGLS